MMKKVICKILLVLLVFSYISISGIQTNAAGSMYIGNTEDLSEEGMIQFDIMDWIYEFSSHYNTITLLSYIGYETETCIPYVSKNNRIKISQNTNYGMLERLSFEEGYILPDSCYKLFDSSNLKEIDLSGVNSNFVTNMDYMFHSCIELTSLNLTSLNTNNVTTMKSMFDGCSSLTSLDISNFNTNKVTSFNYMFRNCISLKNLDLSSFDTRRGPDVYGMFENCKSLETLNLSSFDFSLNSNGVSLSLETCGNLQVLDIPRNYTNAYYWIDDLPRAIWQGQGNSYGGIPPKQANSFKIYRCNHDSWKWTRLAGSTRFTTMSSIIGEGFSEDRNKSLTKIILATGESFPDALAGASLAGVYKCPIVLTRSSNLSSEAESEIRRLASPNGCTVTILGGTYAISDAVERAVQNIGGHIKTERVSGSNREKTSIAVYNKGLIGTDGFSKSDTVIITTGYNFADALSISSYAYATKTPILLSKKDGSLSKEVKNLVSETRIQKVIILGGKKAVSEETEDYLKSMKTVIRIAGKTRYETSAIIVKWVTNHYSVNYSVKPLIEMSIRGMGVASGDNFPDALASVSLLGDSKSVLLLVDNTKNRATIEYNINNLIKDNYYMMGKGFIFGGTLAVSKEIEKMLNDASSRKN